MRGVPLLSARDLAIGYRSRRRSRNVLSGLDLAVERGELICLVGRNGSGKSTLLRTLAGLLPPLGGRIELAGEALASSSDRARARRLAVVLPQSPVIGPVTVWETAALGRQAHTSWNGKLRAEDRRIVSRALEVAGAAELAGRRVEALSDGERQKVMIARALAQEAPLLLLDEPTAFLDVTARAELFATLDRLAGEGHGIVVSTHDLAWAVRRAERLWLADRGTLTSGPPAKLRGEGHLERAFGLGGRMAAPAAVP